jgi:alpha-D-xyloside xylohydrolase
MHWDDRDATLTIGQRQGTFAGMLGRRTFNVVFVSKDKPVGFSFGPVIDRTIVYEGQPVSARR